jgi:hypothetical protein
VILVYENGPTVQLVEFDATIRELHAGTATATEHDEEEGGPVTDHVRAERARYTAEVVVSNKPIRAVGGHVGVQAPIDVSYLQNQRVSSVAVTMLDVPPHGPVPTIRGEPTVKPANYAQTPVPLTVNVLQFPTPFDRVRDVHAELERLRISGTRLYIAGHLKDYDSMVITSVSAPFTAEGSIRLTLELQQIRVASLVVVDVVPLEPRAQAKKASGAKAGYTLPAQKESLAHRYGDKAASLFDRSEVDL